MFVVDFSSDNQMSGINPDEVTSASAAAISIHAKFGKPLDKTKNFILFLGFDKVITINMKTRSVTYDWK